MNAILNKFILNLLVICTTLYGQEHDWKNMYPLHDGDYWVWESYGPGNYLASTKTKRVLGDSLEPNRLIYKIIKVKDYHYNDIIEYQELDRIDSLGSVFIKYPWEKTEVLFLKLNVAVGDTFSVNSDNDGTYWTVSEIFFINDSTRIIYYSYNGIAPGYIGLKENIGYIGGGGEGGGSEILKGAYINGLLTGDTTVVSSIERQKNSLPKNLMLFQNYPNPFNPATNIEFELNKRTKVEIFVYDSQGKQVAKILNEIKYPGRYSVIFEAKNLAAGIYFYNLKTKDFSISKKMLLIK